MTIKTSNRIWDVHDGLCHARIRLARYEGRIKALEDDLGDLRNDLAKLDDLFIDALINYDDEEEEEEEEEEDE